MELSGILNQFSKLQVFVVLTAMLVRQRNSHPRELLEAIT